MTHLCVVSVRVGALWPRAGISVYKLLVITCDLLN